MRSRKFDYSKWAHCKSSIAYCLVGLLMLGATIFMAHGRGRSTWLIIVIDIIYLVALSFHLYWNDCLPLRPQPQGEEAEEKGNL